MAESELLIEDEDDRKSEEFSCPPGHITVDVVDNDGHQGRGIHVYYFSPDVGDSDMISHTMLPSKKQWHHVKEDVLKWLEQLLT